jgi:predicted MPP superfamily phosphohydrolase
MAVIRNNTIVDNNDAGIYNTGSYNGQTIKIGWATDTHSIDGDENSKYCLEEYSYQSPIIKIPKMMETMVNENVDLVIFTGDNSERGYQSPTYPNEPNTIDNIKCTVSAIDGPNEPYGIERHLVVGNHDYVNWPDSNNKEGWLDIVKENAPNNAYQNGYGLCF